MNVSSNPKDDLMYRAGVNSLLRAVTEDEDLTAAAQAKWIDRPNWLGFLNSYRRRLIKEPVEALGGEGAYVQLCLELQTMEALRSANRITQMSDMFEDAKQRLFAAALAQAESDLAELIVAFKSLSTTSDLSVPHNWYPVTRCAKRRIIYHGGPTNSGKTYHALQRLRDADPAKGGGLYCGPLRLLALEVFETLNRQGVFTSLLTGQERREVPGATHVSSTLEMVNMSKAYDVVVIDEIQMIADKDRGYAWTRALLGLQANEIHLCGGLEAESIVRSLVESAGDEFELKNYERLSTLEIEPQALRGDYSKVQPGDCIVAFSKADIFSIRREIEKHTPYKCAVIYGQLPPETRSTQARLFNEEDTGFDVLVASDAIGMGLNLNIRRIVFHTTLKRNKTGVYWVEPSGVKQIAGRAGRLSSKFKVGLVTAWQEVDLAYVRAVMAWDIPQITSAGIFPSVEQVELFAEQLRKVHSVTSEVGAAEEAELAQEGQEGQEGDFAAVVMAVADADAEEDIAGAGLDNDNDGGRTMEDLIGEVFGTEKESEKEKREGRGGKKELKPSEVPNPMVVMNLETSIRLSDIMDKYVQLSRIDGRFHLCDHASMLVVSNWLHTIPLSISDRFVFSNAPVNIQSAFSMVTLYEYAAKFAMKRPVALNVRLSSSLPSDLDGFSDLCVRHNILDLYQWLSNRFPKYFIEHDLCLEQKSFAIQQIEATLLSSPVQREYSHGSTYMFLRNKQKKAPQVEGGGADPVREAFIANLAQVPPQLHHVVDAKDMHVWKKSQFGKSGGGAGAGRSSGGRRG
eukprot:CAMPEP_0173197620 /NCGR_PEP_ID=MMETSP1141-20130122/16262_1 /TAXON_ID=483371 /ORGANISM="non described non described, Strain CCMP2298" /LENGTH=797 /DNA_ID=CAMNT_0014122381 /DNA_START=155 /DNA_END=2548 /DNA_ORIENTATION=-